MHNKKEVKLQVLETEIEHGGSNRAIGTFLKEVSKVSFSRGISLKYPGCLNSVGRCREMICILSLLVSRSGAPGFACTASS